MGTAAQDGPLVDGFKKMTPHSTSESAIKGRKGADIALHPPRWGFKLGAGVLGAEAQGTGHRSRCDLRRQGGPRLSKHRIDACSRIFLLGEPVATRRERLCGNIRFDLISLSEGREWRRSSRPELACLSG